MSESPRIKKIVWAIDAFDPPTSLQKHAARLVQTLSQSAQVEIQPAYMLTPSQLNLSVEYAIPMVQQYRPAAEKALQGLVQQLHLSGLLEPKVLIENFTSTQSAVDSLAKYAWDEKADMILVTTHGRKGMSRFLMGSFAETLLLRSPVPVLSIGPGVRRIRGIKRILFPTEFGRYSKRVFKRAVCLARDLKAEILLFHAIPHPVEPIFQSGVYLIGGSWVPVRTYFNSEIDRHQKRAEAWARWANHEGVTTDILVDTQARNVVETILNLIHEREIGMVMMEAESGPVASTLLGSVTREVIRAAGAPIWVIRPAATIAATQSEADSKLRKAS